MQLLGFIKEQNHSIGTRFNNVLPKNIIIKSKCFFDVHLDR